MPNTLIKLRKSGLKAFSLLESLVTLTLVSFLTLALAGPVRDVFEKSQETIFFLTFQQVYVDSQKLAIAGRQAVDLDIQENQISNGYQVLKVPESMEVVQPISLHFQENGGNSSLAKVQFQTSRGLVTYQLYLGSGRYKKSKT